MKELKNGDKVRLKRRIWCGVKGFIKIKKSDSVPRGATGVVVGRTRWEGKLLYRVNFGKYGTWGAERSILEKI